MTEQPKLSFSPSALLTAYREKRYDDVSEIFLDILMHFRNQTYQSMDRKMKYFVDAFVKHFLYMFTQEDYVPADRHMARFIDLNPIISNLVAISSFRTTDPFIEILSGQTRNFAKMLALYSPRNMVRIDRKMLFNTEPAFATQWYFCFWENYKSCCAGKNSLQHMREHLQFQDDRMGAINAFVHHAYFGCTYADFENDHLLKRHVNKIFQSWDLAKTPIANAPNPKKVAVITSMWFPRQSVYRCTLSFIKALAEQFELTLVHLGPKREDLDTSLFKDVRQFQITQNPKDLSMFTPNDWAIAYYPDIGMNIESIFLSNMRLAPVQICGYGHPVSTFGSKIDYWLGGRDIESIEEHERNYTERLLLVPGSGVAPNKPDYKMQETFVSGDILFINCAWTAQKINYPMLERLKRILDGAKRKIKFRFFPGGAIHGNGYIPLKRDLSDVLGAENVDLFRDMPYHEYMSQLEQGDFSLDSYPFGGYATATDAIYLRKPIVTWEGTKFYNRSAASLLRHVGLDELIARDGDAYEALALKLIHDDAYRKRLTAKLAKADLDKTIFDHDDARAVAKAFQHVLANHATLQQDGHRKPIVVKA